MAKQSKRNRRRMHQAGMGGGFTVVRRVPIRVQRNLPNAPTLSLEAYERLASSSMPSAPAWRKHPSPSGFPCPRATAGGNATSRPI